MLPPLPHHGLTLLLVQYSIYTLNVFCLLIGGVLYRYIRCDKQHPTPINFEYFYFAVYYESSNTVSCYIL